MLNPIASSIVYMAEMLVIYIFYFRISEINVSTWKCLLIGFLLFECASCVNLLFQNNVMLNTVISLMIYFLFAVFGFGIRPISSLFYSILLVVSNFILEILVILMYTTLTNGVPADINQNPVFFLLAVISNKTLLLLLCLLLSKEIQPCNIRIQISTPMLFYPIALAICLVLFWKICLAEGVTEEIQLYVASACIVFFVATVSLFIIYQHQIEESTQHMEVENELRKLQQERKYYQILEQQNENLMIYAHDAKKHLAAITSLTNDPDIQEYIGKLSDQLKTYSKNCHSGNRLLDVIIHKYSLDCESKGISFYYDVRQCNLSEVQDIDLVGIIGNLMDNAVNAAIKTSEKQISLETTCRNEYSVLIISNSCNEPPIIREKHLVSSQNGFHGFGLKSVSKSVKKYQGDFSWEYDERNHIFTITVMIGKQLDGTDPMYNAPVI